ncbi:MAG: FAD-binding protein [Planctomycetes bacterium]|nr:FAD-binding protein [Planctomycetota bacterium]
MGKAPEKAANRTDILVIGQGIAGLIAAIESKKSGLDVTLISDSSAANESSFPISSTRGIQIAFNEQEIESISNEIFSISENSVQKDLVYLMLQRSKNAFKLLQQYGLSFKKNENGLVRVAGCFGSAKTAVILESTEELKKLKKIAQDIDVKFITDQFCIKLCVKDPVCYGAYFSTSNGIIQHKAKATILATGGYSGLYKTRVTTGNAIGTNIYLVNELKESHNIILPLSNLEFIQLMIASFDENRIDFFHSTRISDSCTPLNFNNEPENNKFSVQEWKEICQSRRKHFPFSSTFISKEFDILIHKLSRGKKAIIEDNNRKFHVKHAAHVCNGGIVIKPDTTVDGLAGLFCIGEAATGMHGSNRLGGAMFTSCIVFGSITAEQATKYAKSITKIPEITDQAIESVIKPNGLNRGEIENYINVIRGLMDSKAMVVRNTGELNQAIQIMNNVIKYVINDKGVDSLKHLREYYKLKTMTEAASTVLQAMVKRTTPTGAHYITDA